MTRVHTTIEIDDRDVRTIMDRYGLHTNAEAVDLALRYLAGQPMSREEALAMRGAGAIEIVPGDSAPPWRGMILADTSAWVEYDRATHSSVDQRLATLIASGGELAVTEPVLMEVLVGARREAWSTAWSRPWRGATTPCSFRGMRTWLDSPT